MFYKGNPRCPVKFYKEYSRHCPLQMTEPESPFYLGLCRNIKDDVRYINLAMGKNTLSKFSSTYPSYANKRSKKRPILNFINNYSYASIEQKNRCQNPF